MKKFLFLAIAAIGLLLSPSCSDENEVLSGSDNEALVSFNVQLADGISTKAIGDGKTVDKLRVRVYEKTGEGALGTHVSALKIDDGTMSALHGEVSLTLVRGKVYNILFWADKGGSLYTITDNNGEVTVTYNGASNDENRDAFFAMQKDVTITGPTTVNVTLNRPLAQLNFLVPASDIKDASDAGFNFASATTHIKIAGVPNVLNTWNRKVSGSSSTAFTEADIPFKDEVNAGTISETADHLTIGVTKYYYLATTYVLATNKDYVNNLLVSTDLTVQNGAYTANTIQLANVPLKWNYRTNIYGNLLTAAGTFNVEITPAFIDPSSDQPFLDEVTVATVADVKAAIEAGARTITVTTAPESSATLFIPKIFNNGNTETIKLIIPATANNYTIGYTGTNYGPANVEINTTGGNNTGNLTITLPQSTVTLNGSVYNQVSASTADNTLIIPEGVTVSTLKVNAGNVDINGTVTNLTLADGCGVLVGTEAKLNDAITNSYSKIILKNDIALTADLEISKEVTIDGKETFYRLDLGTHAIRIEEAYSPIIFNGVDFYSDQTATQFAIQADLTGAGNLYFNNCVFCQLSRGVIKAQLSNAQGGNLFIEECKFKGPIVNTQYLDISASGIPGSAPTVRIIGNDFDDMTGMAVNAINLDLGAGCIYVGNNSFEESTVTEEHGIHCGELTLEQLISAFTDSDVDITLFDKTNN